MRRFLSRVIWHSVTAVLALVVYLAGVVVGVLWFTNVIGGDQIRVGVLIGGLLLAGNGICSFSVYLVHVERRTDLT